jgi:ATP phosphoribosyltransferase
VEVAPVLGLADCVVDLVQTGKTLAANQLEIDEVLFESTARLIVNRASFRLKGRSLGEFVTSLSNEVGQ